MQKRIGNHSLFLGFEAHGKKYRRGFTKDQIIKQLFNDKLPEDSNLKPGADEISFEEFCLKIYLPNNAIGRMSKDSYATETFMVAALVGILGQIPLHEIENLHWGKYKLERKSKRSGLPCKANTLLHERGCLYMILEYAVEIGRIRRNPLLGFRERSLIPENRAEFWLTTPQIEKFLDAAAELGHRDLFELMFLTGARRSEVRLLKQKYLELKPGYIAVPTLKRGVPPEQALRFLEIQSLGPRFSELLSRLTPAGGEGYFFPGYGDDEPVCSGTLNYWFYQILKIRPEFSKYHLHDTRGTFTVHRAMVIKSFRQLMVELGHTNAQSVQSYLAIAEAHLPEESIFFEPVAPAQWTQNRTIIPSTLNQQIEDMLGNIE